MLLKAATQWQLQLSASCHWTTGLVTTYRHYCGISVEIQAQSGLILPTNTAYTHYKLL
ncbi:hypothetical protein BKA69DRAFT_1066581 [Paraphysoderma sedebokerense]|nr:hypothetical protein BKA69DRAFT_1066581 [Paraphysoderma sedebokerense]